MNPIEGTVIPKFDPKDVEDHKVMASLSYIGVLCLIPLLFMKNSAYAQTHAKQGVLLFLVWLVGSLVFWFPLIGQLAALAVFVVNVFVFIKCLQGEFWEIPVLGAYRNKVNL